MEKTLIDYKIMTVRNSKGQLRYYPARYLDPAGNWTQNIFPGRVFKTPTAAVNAAEAYICK